MQKYTIQNTMKTFGPYILIDKFDIDELRKNIISLTDNDWDNELDFRKKRFRVHSETQSIVLLWNNNPYPLFSIYNKFVQPIFDLVAKTYKIEKPVITKAMFVLLPAGAVVKPHIDVGINIRVPHRIHVPIVTNEKVKMLIDDKPYYFEEGIIYEFNNTLKHSVENNSDEPRIHLIFDICDQSKLC
jgi:hypothetical protein